MPSLLETMAKNLEGMHPECLAAVSGSVSAMFESIRDPQPDTIKERRAQFLHMQKDPVRARYIDGLDEIHRKLLKAHDKGYISWGGYESAALSVYDSNSSTFLNGEANIVIDCTWSVGKGGVLSPEMQRQRDWLVAFAKDPLGTVV